MGRGALILALVVVSVFVPRTARAYLLTEDLPNLGTAIANEIKNYANWLKQEFNQEIQLAHEVTEITNQLTQITQVATQIARFGNPNYYVQLLGLNTFLNSVENLELGVGQTISAYRQAANGLAALSYTANGIYSNLAGTIDRFGNPVQFNPNAFKKFSTVNNMVESYNTQQTTFNTQMAALQADLASAVKLLNADSTQMGTVKYAAKVNALSAQMNALGHTTNLTGQRAALQQVSNQNDAARTAEATREQRIQERQEDLQNEAAGFSNLIGGGNGGGALP
jgi:hypothetical protein